MDATSAPPSLIAADAWLPLPAAGCWLRSTFPALASCCRAPPPPAVNIKSVLLQRLRGCEGPRPCRAERTPSLTRAPLLSPESQMRLRPCWAIHHPPSASGRGQKGPWRRTRALPPPPPPLRRAVDCGLCRGEANRQRCLLVYTPLCGRARAKRRLQGERGARRRPGGAAVNRALICFASGNSTKHPAEQRLQLRTDKFVCGGRVVSEHHFNSSAAACDVM